MFTSRVCRDLATVFLTGLAFASTDTTWFVVSRPGVNSNAHLANSTSGDPSLFSADSVSKVTTPPDGQENNGSVEINLRITATPGQMGHGIVGGGPTIVVQNIHITCCAPSSVASLNETQQRTRVNITREPSCPANKSYPCPIEPVGCFRDSYVAPRPLPELIADFRRIIDRNNVNKTIEACAREARRRGFKFFGIQAYGDCWSGNGAEQTYNRDGASKYCSNGIGKTGANFVYRFPRESPRPCKNCGKPRHLCFPGKSEVELSDGRLVPMSELKLGDKVKTLDSHRTPVYSEVIIFLHKNENVEGEFYNIVTDDGSQITLSAKHLIFVKKNVTGALFSAIFASEIELGNYLYVDVKRDGFSYRPVVTISKVTKKGLYAPLTSEGTLIVDNVFVSCYAHWWSHDLANVAMAPVRLYLYFMGLLSSSGEWARPLVNHWNLWENGDEIHWYPGLLMKITSSLTL